MLRRPFGSIVCSYLPRNTYRRLRPLRHGLPGPAHLRRKRPLTGRIRPFIPLHPTESGILAGAPGGVSRGKMPFEKEKNGACEGGYRWGPGPPRSTAGRASGPPAPCGRAPVARRSARACNRGSRARGAQLPGRPLQAPLPLEGLAQHDPPGRGEGAGAARLRGRRHPQGPGQRAPGQPPGRASRGRAPPAPGAGRRQPASRRPRSAAAHSVTLRARRPIRSVSTILGVGRRRRPGERRGVGSRHRPLRRRGAAGRACRAARRPGGSTRRPPG